MGEGDGERLLDLAGLGDGGEIAADHRQHRSHGKPRHRAMRGQRAQHLDLGGVKADLLMRLAQGGGDLVGIVGIDLAAGQRDLARMVAQPAGALGQDQPPVGVERGQHTGRTRAQTLGRAAVQIEIRGRPRGHIQRPQQPVADRRGRHCAALSSGLPSASTVASNPSDSGANS